MQVVWEADTTAFHARKRAARACMACQKKKKRCNHTFTRAPDQQAESDGVDKVLPNLTHKEPVRFVGDLNPESILTDIDRSKDLPRVSRIGTFVQDNSRGANGIQLPAQDPPQSRSGEKTPINVEKYARADGGKRTLTGQHRAYLQSVGAFRVLPKATQDALVTTYIACFDGLLPIIDCGKLLRDYTAGSTSLFLIQAICLVICKIPDAQQWLRLYEDGPLLDPIPFARSLHVGLDAAMKADLEPDRVTKVQILTLMHLHNDGPGGIEESSFHLSQAIHDAWTAGLHIQTPGRTLVDQASMLWWTIWALDRFNACIGGRPIMIADRDIDLSRPPVDSSVRNPSALIWIRLGDLLDQVIEYYRPASYDPEASGWEHDFPSWASLRDGIDLSDNTGHTQIIVLEIAYNVTAILSCRNASPAQPSYARRIAAADRIQALLTDVEPRGVPPIPLVPYAIGLSLTVAYRCIRSPSTANPEQQKENLNTRSKMLESLSQYWWTADAMAKLGRKALKSMQNPVGMKRNEVESLATDMESEVTVCKFGPFEAKSALPPSRTGVSGDALRLLSDAAARHSTTTPQSTKTYGSTPSRATHSNNHPHNSFDSGSYQPTPNTESLHTPSTADMQALTTTNGQMAMNPPTPAYDQSMFAKFSDDFPGNNLSELDNMFDGFYDLSIPTITFEDTLFQGFWPGMAGSGDDGSGFVNNYNLAAFDTMGVQNGDGVANVAGPAGMGTGHQQQQQVGGANGVLQGQAVGVSQYPDLS